MRGPLALFVFILLFFSVAEVAAQPAPSYDILVFGPPSVPPPYPKTVDFEVDVTNIAGVTLWTTITVKHVRFMDCTITDSDIPISVTRGKIARLYLDDQETVSLTVSCLFKLGAQSLLLAIMVKGQPDRYHWSAGYQESIVVPIPQV